MPRVQEGLKDTRTSEMRRNRIVADVAMTAILCAQLALAGCDPAATNDAEPTEKDLLIGGRDSLVPSEYVDELPPDIEFPDFKSGKVERRVSIRDSAVQEAAQTYGSQHGYRKRALEILRLLERRSSELSAVYDFNRVAMPAPLRTGFVIPPVVARSFVAHEFEAGGQASSAADEYLEILRPGRLSPVVPTWRDYLLIDVDEPGLPPSSLMPSDSSEEKKFRSWFGEGWWAGKSQAEAEFAHRLRRLRRDYEGMLEYRRLIAAGLMSRLVIADADLGDVGTATTLRLGERSVRIISQSEFNAGRKDGSQDSEDTIRPIGGIVE